MAYAKWSWSWWSIALGAVVTVFLAFSVPPYLTGGTRVPATFALHYPLLVAHVLFATVAIVAAVVQIWPRLRSRHPVLHRRFGRVYVATAVSAALCAFAIGAGTPFGPVLAVSNVVLATLWLWFTLSGLVAARQRRFADHRRHMIRSVTLALSIITNRIWTPIMFVAFHPLQDSVFEGNEEHFIRFAAGAGAWLGWTVPLAIVQWWLHRQRLMTRGQILR